MGGGRSWGGGENVSFASPALPPSPTPPVTGGSISNMYAMNLARFQRYPDCKQRGLRALPPLALFTSKEVGKSHRPDRGLLSVIFLRLSQRPFKSSICPQWLCSLLRRPNTCFCLFCLFGVAGVGVGWGDTGSTSEGSSWSSSIAREVVRNTESLQPHQF